MVRKGGPFKEEFSVNQSPKAPPVFCLVDCNNFYVSCERVFQPRLNNKAVVVLSNNDGCIVARSEESKALGIRMGEPFFQCKDLIEKHQVEVFSSNYVLYADMSNRVMNTLSNFSPNVEVYSIDESFLSFRGFEKYNLTDYTRQMRKTVKQYTGIPVSVGVAKTKTLAKIANKIAKKVEKCQGVLDLSDYSDMDRVLRHINVGDVWGIGRKYTEFLNRHGIYTAKDLKYADDTFIKKNMTITGLRTVYELRGISCLPLEEIPDKKKEIVRSRGFGQPVENLWELKEAITTYITRAAEKLREQGLLTR